MQMLNLSRKKRNRITQVRKKTKVAMMKNKIKISIGLRIEEDI